MDMGADQAPRTEGREKACSGLAYRGSDARLELAVGMAAQGCAGLGSPGAQLVPMLLCPKWWFA